MKTMTCRELGGPCDLAHTGDSGDDVIKAQDAHLKQVVAEGQEDHREAHEEMQGRWKRPISGLKWYLKAKKDFAALPEQ